MVYLEVSPMKFGEKWHPITWYGVRVCEWLVSICVLNKWWYFEQWQATEAVIWPVTRKRIRTLTWTFLSQEVSEIGSRLVLGWLVVIELIDYFYLFFYWSVLATVPSEIWRKLTRINMLNIFPQELIWRGHTEKRFRFIDDIWIFLRLNARIYERSIQKQNIQCQGNVTF